MLAYASHRYGYDGTIHRLPVPGAACVHPTEQPRLDSAACNHHHGSLMKNPSVVLALGLVGIVALLLLVRQNSSICSVNSPFSQGTTRGLSAGELSGLKSEYRDPASGQMHRFMATFEQTGMQLGKTNPIPYRITAQLFEVRTDNGMESLIRASGQVLFYIQDSEGRLVEQGSESVDQLCPS